jgi:hypothetical protein
MTSTRAVQLRAYFLSIFPMLLLGCAPRVPVTDVATVDSAERANSATIQIFVLGQQPPKVQRVIGNIDAFSCKHMMWDPPASKGNALEQLQLKAEKAGADAVINVTFDTRGADAYGTNCWQSVQASGLAVQLVR